MEDCPFHRWFPGAGFNATISHRFRMISAQWDHHHPDSTKADRHDIFCFGDAACKRPAQIHICRVPRLQSGWTKLTYTLDDRPPELTSQYCAQPPDTLSPPDPSSDQSALLLHRAR